MAEDWPVPMQDRPQTGTEQPHSPIGDAAVDYASFMLDLHGRVSGWNPSAQHRSGYAAEEVVGKPFALFFAEEDRHLGRPDADLEAARLRGRSETEGWRVRKDGTRFWALAVLDAMRDEAGRLIGFAQAIRDMTERREAKQALLE